MSLLCKATNRINSISIKIPTEKKKNPNDIFHRNRKVPSKIHMESQGIPKA